MLSVTQVAPEAIDGAEPEASLSILNCLFFASHTSLHVGPCFPTCDLCLERSGPLLTPMCRHHLPQNLPGSQLQLFAAELSPEPLGLWIW